MEFIKLYSSPSIIKSDQIKEDNMGGVYSMHGKDEKCIQNFGQKT